MADPITPDDVDESSGKRESFVGRVVGSSVDGVVEESGYEDGSSEYERDIDHFAYIEVLDGTHEKNQNVFGMDVSTDPMSKWMVQIMHLTEIHGNLREEHGVDSYTDVLEFIQGRVYRFEDITWTEDETYPVYGDEHGITYARIGQERDPNSMWVFSEEVTDEDELVDLGVEEDTGEVESVDI